MDSWSLVIPSRGHPWFSTLLLCRPSSRESRPSVDLTRISTWANTRQIHHCWFHSPAHLRWPSLRSGTKIFCPFLRNRVPCVRRGSSIHSSPVPGHAFSGYPSSADNQCWCAVDGGEEGSGGTGGPMRGKGEELGGDLGK